MTKKTRKEKEQALGDETVKQMRKVKIYLQRAVDSLHASWVIGYLNEGWMEVAWEKYQRNETSTYIPKFVICLYDAPEDTEVVAWIPLDNIAYIAKEDEA